MRKLIQRQARLDQFLLEARWRRVRLLHRECQSQKHTIHRRLVDLLRQSARVHQSARVRQWLRAYPSHLVSLSLRAHRSRQVHQWNRVHRSLSGWKR